MAGEAAQAIGGQSTYYQWPKGSAPAPPYILFYFPGSEDFFADDTIFQRIRPLNLELYTDNKDFDAEAAVEQILLSHGLTFTRTESYIESEQLYEVLYQMEVTINA